MIYNDIQEYSRIYKNIQEYKRIYNNISADLSPVAHTRQRRTEPPSPLSAVAHAHESHPRFVTKVS